MVRVFLAVAVLAAACRSEKAADGPCTCTPANTIRTKGVSETEPPDGAVLVARLRRHRDDVRAGRNPRDIKVQDDQLRFLVVELCQPCGAWVSDRMTMEELYPLEKIDQAVRATCLGLVLTDGTTAWGAARPQNCR
jgi:hypothetical protein